MASVRAGEVGGARKGVNGGGGTAAVSESMATLHSTPARFLLQESSGRRGEPSELLVGARGGRRRRGFVGDGEARVRFLRGIERSRGNGRGKEWDRGREGFVVFIHARVEAAASIAEPGIDGRCIDTELVADGERDKRDFLPITPCILFSSSQTSPFDYFNSKLK